MPGALAGVAGRLNSAGPFAFLWSLRASAHSFSSKVVGFLICWGQVPRGQGRGCRRSSKPGPDPAQIHFHGSHSPSQTQASQSHGEGWGEDR